MEILQRHGIYCPGLPMGGYGGGGGMGGSGSGGYGGGGGGGSSGGGGSGGSGGGTPSYYAARSNYSCACGPPNVLPSYDEMMY